MTNLPVRKLLIDLSTPFDVRWNGNDAFRSAFFNALSMSFPVGEQYFMDSVRSAMKVLAPEVSAQFAQEVQGFIGQEATHRRIHSLFNSQLEKQGFKNTVGPRALLRMQANAHREIHIHVGATAATEHLTAIFADWILTHGEAFEGTEPRLQTLWMWHASEESEHRSTAFDIYRALGGSEKARLRTFHIISFLFLLDITRQTLRNLWTDKAFWKWSTWRSCWNLLLRRDGMFRGNFAAWKAYEASDFHPRHSSNHLARHWLSDNIHQFSPITSEA